MMEHARPDRPHHPELHRLAEALRQQPALAERYARAADLDALQARLSEDGYAVPRAALEHAMAQSELSEAQLDQVQGGVDLDYLLYIFAVSQNPDMNQTFQEWTASQRRREIPRRTLAWRFYPLPSTPE